MGSGKKNRSSQQADEASSSSTTGHSRKSQSVRHSKNKASSRETYSRPMLKRFSELASIERVQGIAYDSLRGAIKELFVKPMAKNTATYVESAGMRRTIRASDIKEAARVSGFKKIYGEQE